MADLSRTAGKTLYKMTLLKRSILGRSMLIALGNMFLPLPGATALADEEVSADKGMYPQASSTIPVYDDRVARIELQKPSAENVSQQEVIVCTANHLGNGFWLTAKHCLADAQVRGDILQADGDRASITKRYFGEKGVDLAVFETDDPTIASRKFDLPGEGLNISDELTLIGFAAVHSYASEAKVEVIEGVQDNYILWQEYRNSFKTVSTTPSRTCGGDSGGAIYVGNEIVGVHSAGPLNRECAGKQGSEMLHTSVLPSRSWIEEIAKMSAEEHEPSGAGIVGSSDSMSGALEF